MKEKDIIDNEIYVYNEMFINRINFKNPDFNVDKYIDLKNNTFHNRQTSNRLYRDYRKATIEEKHWLNRCIQFDIFISKQEALSEFELPEFWHVISQNEIEGRIIGKWFDNSRFKSSDSTDSNFYENYGSHHNILRSFGGLGPGNVLGNTCGIEITYDQFVKYVLGENKVSIVDDMDYLIPIFKKLEII